MIGSCGLLVWQVKGLRGALHLLQMVCLDADVACWVTVGRLWASLRVAKVAFSFGLGGFGLVCRWSFARGFRIMFVFGCGWLPCKQDDELSYQCVALLPWWSCVLLAPDILWHFLCGGLSACWI